MNVNFSYNNSSSIGINYYLFENYTIFKDIINYDKLKCIPHQIFDFQKDINPFLTLDMIENSRIYNSKWIETRTCDFGEHGCGFQGTNCGCLYYYLTWINLLMILPMLMYFLALYIIYLHLKRSLYIFNDYFFNDPLRFVLILISFAFYLWEFKKTIKEHIYLKQIDKSNTKHLADNKIDQKCGLKHRIKHDQKNDKNKLNSNCFANVDSKTNIKFNEDLQIKSKDILIFGLIYVLVTLWIVYLLIEEKDYQLELDNILWNFGVDQAFMYIIVNKIILKLLLLTYKKIY